MHSADERSALRNVADGQPEADIAARVQATRQRVPIPIAEATHQAPLHCIDVSDGLQLANATAVLIASPPCYRAY
ncbi:hypothetical protein B7R77_18780 [Ralstonia solanacearum K60]|uniref:Uncharacterized protein n=2 Tax=Ralstonia solanacearum TaxID=305 RepID=A0AAP8D1Q7_RALSL|nr:hypothetical protein B7R77_18780 [Ralstonia solanacearum K60]